MVHDCNWTSSEAVVSEAAVLQLPAQCCAPVAGQFREAHFGTQSWLVLLKKKHLTAAMIVRAFPNGR